MASGLQYLEEAPKVGKALGLDLPLFPQHSSLAKVGLSSGGGAGPWPRTPGRSCPHHGAPGLGVGLPASLGDVSPLQPRPQFLAFTCGLLRGALSTLGIKSLVTASVASLPTCELWGRGPPCPSCEVGLWNFPLLAPPALGGGARLLRA